MPSRRVFSIGALRKSRESAKVSLGAMLARYGAGICVFTGQIVPWNTGLFAGTRKSSRRWQTLQQGKPRSAIKVTVTNE
jgi:hypothetical protein